MFHKLLPVLAQWLPTKSSPELTQTPQSQHLPSLPMDLVFCKERQQAWLTFLFTVTLLAKTHHICLSLKKTDAN
jgi:hypothetical protein